MNRGRGDTGVRRAATAVEAARQMVCRRKKNTVDSPTMFCTGSMLSAAIRSVCVSTNDQQRMSRQRYISAFPVASGGEKVAITTFPIPESRSATATALSTCHSLSFARIRIETSLSGTARLPRPFQFSSRPRSDAPSVRQGRPLRMCCCAFTIPMALKRYEAFFFPWVVDLASEESPCPGRRWYSFSSSWDSLDFSPEILSMRTRRIE